MAQEKTAIATGANSGIGFEASVGLAEAGFKVVMGCRSLEKANRAKERILARVSSADLEVSELDLSDTESVRQFAPRFKEQHPHLARRAALSMRQKDRGKGKPS